GLVGSATAILVVALTVAIASLLVKEASDRQTQEQQLRGIAESKQEEAERQQQEADTQRRSAESERGEARKQKQEANTQRGEAEKQRRLADRYLYFSRINLAHQAWQEAQLTRMDELLEQTQPEHTGGEDLRNLEWHYLRRLRQTNLFDLKGYTG